MYELMIVDDEEAIRKGIANSNPWKEWGFEVTAVLANGEEAVKKIQERKPHVVLSDIRMPKMDGVALMQYLNQNYPEIKIVILSGYNDFEYLNMSIKNQVTEYLLKPTDVDEFEELFRRMKKTLDEEEAKKREYEALKKLAESMGKIQILQDGGIPEETKNENKKKNTVALCVRDLVDREYCSNLMSLEYVAEKVKKNTAYISRSFKNEFGCNFSDYVTRKRLDYSKELLTDPALKVYEVAEKTGWADVSNFIKVFKRFCGSSPSEYRSMMIGKQTHE